jgi:ferredoxin-thioredoxin reductase catalytic subunit
MVNGTEDIDPFIRKPLETAEKIAKKHGYVLNPDQGQLHRLARHLAENKENFGRFYCPCKQHFPVQPDNDPVCPCPTFHEEVKAQGHCVCHLYFSPEAAEQAKQRPGLLAGVMCPG